MNICLLVLLIGGLIWLGLLACIAYTLRMDIGLRREVANAINFACFIGIVLSSIIVVIAESL